MEDLLRFYVKCMLSEVGFYTAPAHDHGYDRPHKPELGGSKETFDVLGKKKRKKRRRRRRRSKSKAQS